MERDEHETGCNLNRKEHDKEENENYKNMETMIMHKRKSPSLYH